MSEDFRVCSPVFLTGVTLFLTKRQSNSLGRLYLGFENLLKASLATRFSSSESKTGAGSSSSDWAKAGCGSSSDRLKQALHGFLGWSGTQARQIVPLISQTILVKVGELR